MRQLYAIHPQFEYLDSNPLALLAPILDALTLQFNGTDYGFEYRGDVIPLKRLFTDHFKELQEKDRKNPFLYRLASRTCLVFQTGDNVIHHRAFPTLTADSMWFKIRRSVRCLSDPHTTFRPLGN